jgi:hypothetical protein
LTFANAVKRPEFLLGKYLGGMATVAVPIALGFALSLLVASTSPWFQLTAEAALRIAALAAVSLVYASVFFLLGLVISSSVRRSSTALILLFFAWICIVIIIPDTSAYVAKQWRPVPAGQEVKAQQSALKGEYWGKMREYAKQNRRPAERWDWDMIIGRSVNSGDIPFAYTCMFAPREAMGWYEKGTAYGVGQAEIYADRERRVYQEYRQHQQQQASLARSIASVSPTWVYSRAAQIVAGTDSERGRRLVRQASAFRDELRSYIGQSDGFSSMAYFTRMTSGDLLSFDELKEIKESRGKEAIAELARPWTEDLAPLQGVPEFRYEPEALGESLVRMAGPATWLVLLNAVLFALAYGSFTRQDLRQEVA